MGASLRSGRVRINALPHWQAQAIIWAGISLTASGLFWLYALLRRGPEDLPGALDHWLARWHGLSSMIGLFAFGMIASRHVPRGWALKSRVVSGLGTVALFGVAALTGFALAYLAPEAWHARLGWAHSALGAAAFGFGAWHRR